MNIFDFAMKMEEDGRQFYDRMAGESGDTGLRTIFQRLAADERKHYEIFQSLQQEGRPEMQETTVLEDARNIFEDLMGEREAILRTVHGDLEGYRYAMKIEAESVEFYEDAARREKNESTRMLLQRIAGEEEKHFTIVENIYDFFNAPNQYLAWREFTNLGEFRQFGREVDL